MKKDNIENNDTNLIFSIDNKMFSTIQSIQTIFNTALSRILS